MQRTQLLNEFKTILTKHIREEDSLVMQNINEETNLAQDLGIESLDVVSIVIDMEDHFKIEIDNNSIRRMSTVGTCLDLIQEKQPAICSQN